MKLPVFFSFLFSLALASPAAFGHGDEIATDPGVAKDHFTAYGQSDRYELTLYYPELNAGQTLAVLQQNIGTPD